MTDDEARERIRAFFREYLRSEPSLTERIVTVVRRERLEHLLEDPEKPQVRPRFFVYEVEEGGLGFDSTGRPVWTVVLHFPRSWIVAVSPSSGEMFRLYGFDEAETEFNRMGLADHSSFSSDPSYLAERFVRLTHDPEGRAVPWLAWHVRHRVERFFYYDYSPNSLSEKLSRRWWTRYGHAVGKLDFGRPVTKTENGSLVRIMVVRTVPLRHPAEDYTSPVPDPVVEEWSILVSNEGKCHVADRKVVVGKKWEAP